MHAAAVGLLCLLLADAPAPPVVPGWQFAVQGSVARRTDAGFGAADKTFDLTLVVVEVGEQSRRLIWTVAESGQGGWSWPDRFGACDADTQGQPAADTGPALWYERGDVSKIIPLPAPLLTPPVELAPQAQWQAGDQSFVVERAVEHDGHDVWRIQGTTGLGRAQTLWLDRQSPLVWAAQRRVFMGQGEEHQLEWRLVAVRQLPADELAQLTAEYRALDALRAALARPPRAADAKLTAPQREALAQRLPAAQTAVRSPLLAPLVTAAERDLALQNQQAGDVAELVARFQDQPAPGLALHGLNGEMLDEDDLLGQVTVLHFWEYRDEPLHEPYGQVGYLDFLYSQRQAEGLRVYGVAVDGRLAEVRTRGAALRSVRKLRSFMNLSYPVLLDDGGGLKAWGDPRTLGAPLPLFVLVGRDGKIAHYHVGHYDIDRDQGLKTLNAEVTRALAVPAVP